MSFRTVANDRSTIWGGGGGGAQIPHRRERPVAGRHWSVVESLHDHRVKTNECQSRERVTGDKTEDVGWRVAMQHEVAQYRITYL